MRKVPFVHWSRVAEAAALLFDVLIEGLYDGRLASMPGQMDGIPDLGGFLSLDALPFIGRDRRIKQGPTESPLAYARRLRGWLGVLRRAATAFGVLEQLHGVLAPSPPRVRLVGANGVWYTRDEDGTFTIHTPAGDGFTISADGASSTPATDPAHPWDWDGGDPFRFWILIYAPAGAIISATEGTYGDSLSFWGEADKTIGTSALKSFVDLARAVVEDAKPAGILCPFIIVAFDPASFNPAAPGPYPAAGMPDGQWGNPWKDDGTGVFVMSRLATARYWRCDP
jgi:hypothetical protein